MSSSRRLNAAVMGALVVCGLIAAAIGVLGVLGVRTATATGQSVTSDELRTAAATAALGHAVDVAYTDGQALLHDDGRASDHGLTARLLDRDIPVVDGDLGALQRLHAGDPPAERADIDSLGNQWAGTRAVLNRLRPGADPAAGTSLAARHAPLSRHLEALAQREESDAVVVQSRSSALSDRLTRLIVISVVIGMLFLVGLAIIGTRALRRVVEPAEDQIEFTDTLQLAQHETEAHQLLQRHLQRTVAGSAVTVLNRNNSADRLEAVTTVPDDSPLTTTLAHAEPRSCLAVRSGRSHRESSNRPALLSCPVCGPCHGFSTCTPLTVSGEVIGAVLANRSTDYKTDEHQQLRDAVHQAAPVLANLRNLAIAEVRAATDSLTGLPNKRAVADTIKRMVAQSSRSLSPLSLLVLDLDHFKRLNDGHGHQVGDQVLANVGAVLRGALRAGDFAGRNGGEEFVVVLPDTDVAGALVSGERIREAIADITLPGLELPISASIGVATYPEHAVNPEKLERLADSALYTAKRTGRNRVVVAAVTEANQSEDDDSHPVPEVALRSLRPH